MLVVGVDGVPVQSTPAETISIAVGQRYDVVVVGKRRPKRNYAFVAYQPDKHEEVVGELRYRDDFETPGPWIWSEPPIDDMYFRPLDTEIRLLIPNREIMLPLYMTKQRRVFVDGYPYVAPLVPTLFTALSTGKMAATTSVYGHGVNPIIVNFGDVVQLEITNHDPLPRPVSKEDQENVVDG
jgi:iron transport multicopper oxidase